ncbi:hypothetical protein EV356DRAFT_259060 [Viridothelium virens]|uniref:Uncharacterized protein n=1 Tax=Viridothelium virens TaxID=1048519 RepID=A0A6A6H2F5_VIRVR|nr:hypothetical protein EV356DRAFT_259060 [Viridothelium virens]
MIRHEVEISVAKPLLSQEPARWTARLRTRVGRVRATARRLPAKTTSLSNLCSSATQQIQRKVVTASLKYKSYSRCVCRKDTILFGSHIHALRQRLYYGDCLRTDSNGGTDYLQVVQEAFTLCMAQAKTSDAAGSDRISLLLSPLLISISFCPDNPQSSISFLALNTTKSRANHPGVSFDATIIPPPQLKPIIWSLHGDVRW